MQQVVIASGNAGKLREIRAALADYSLSLPAQADFGIAAAAEPHPTFLENALAKARQAAEQTGLPALADDSGIVVPALGNAPGVRSARFAGDDADDAKNNAALLAAVREIAPTPAFYYAVIVVLPTADAPAPVVAEGYWHGEIIATPRGSGGFGYDPLFYDPQAGKTAAEMTVAEKLEHSHRGESLREMTRLLHRRGWLEKR